VTVLQKHKDYEDFYKLRADCETIDGLNDLQKEEARRAFQFLKEELGDHFLKSAYASKHPICFHISNRAPWTRVWITSLAKAIEQVKGKRNYTGLRARLLDATRFEEGRSVLTNACRFVRAGFDIAFDPPVKISGVTKRPDLSLSSRETREKLLGEVSILRQSDYERRAFDVFRQITWSISAAFLESSGRVMRVLSPKRLPSVMEEVQRAVGEAKETGRFRELHIDGVLDLGIAPRNDKVMLEKWADAKGYRPNEVIGPGTSIDEINRIKKKIAHEVKHFPENRANILLIPIHFPIMPRQKTPCEPSWEMERIISELEEELHNYPHLLVLVLTHSCLGGLGLADVGSGLHRLVTRKSGLLEDEHLILFNRACDRKVTPVTLARFYDAFTNFGPLGASVGSDR